MNRMDRIRLRYTYLQQSMDQVGARTHMAHMTMDALWGDVKTGAMTTDRIGELAKQIRELKKSSDQLLAHLEEMEDEIRQMASEEQIRMNYG